MMKLYIALLAASLLLLSGCGNKPKPGEDDTLTSGTITIAVDETFRPIAKVSWLPFIAAKWKP